MKYLLLLLLLGACTSKYDTSKAVSLISDSNDLLTGYVPAEIELELNSDGNVLSSDMNFSQSVLTGIESANGYLFDGKKVFYLDGKKLGLVDIQTLKKLDIKLDSKYTHFTLSDNMILVYNLKGDFAFFQNDNLNLLWKGNTKIYGLSSEFTCSKDECYAFLLSGEILTLDIMNKKQTINPVTQKHNIVLDILYKPLVINDKIIFFSGNTEFGIFSISNHALLGQTQFVNEDDSSIFDIHVINKIHNIGEKYVLIDNTQGLYGLSIFDFRPLWTKKWNAEILAKSNNFLAFWDSKQKKLAYVFVESGEIKWIVDSVKKPVAMYFDDQKNLVVFYANFIKVINTQETSDIKNINISIKNPDLIFIHENKLHYVRAGKIYKIS